MACLAVAWTAAASLPCIILGGIPAPYVIAWASCGWGEVPEPRLPKGLYFKHKISPQHAIYHVRGTCICWSNTPDLCWPSGCKPRLACSIHHEKEAGSSDNVCLATPPSLYLAVPLVSHGHQADCRALCLSGRRTPYAPTCSPRSASLACLPYACRCDSPLSRLLESSSWLGHSSGCSLRRACIFSKASNPVFVTHACSSARDAAHGAGHAQCKQTIVQTCICRQGALTTATAAADFTSQKSIQPMIVARA